MASSEPLLDKKRPAASVLSRLGDWLLCCFLPLLCLGLIGTASFQALRNARQDPWTAAFAVAADAVLLLLWVCFRQFEKLAREPSSATARGSLKLLIWILCVLLNVIFSLRVTLTLDSPVMYCFVWSVAGATTLAGAYLLFFSSPAPPPAASGHATPPPVLGGKV